MKIMKITTCANDILPAGLFKNALSVIGPSIVEICNASLLTGVVPRFCKHAVVEPILKKSSLDPTQLKNYRPISKLPLLSKILEKVVADQLTTFLEKHEIYDKFQSGFRKRHSTETALLKVSSDIMMSADSGASSVMVLLDLTSAFDTIDHTILINRLRDIVGVSGLALEWFRSYLSNRSFSVFANRFMSHSKDLTCGVPQGSVLGPILFLLYMLRLGLIIRQFPEVSYHFYADDIQLYCSFKPMEVHKLSSLINCLASIEQWLGDNYLQLNSETSETLIIAPDNQISLIKQHLGSLGSSVHLSLRYLGVIFDSAMSLEQHSRQLIRNCLFQLRNISKLRTLLSKSELEMVIHAFISSRLDYCNSLFLCLSKRNLDRLQLVQNAAARLLTKTRKREHITPVLRSLHWLPVHFRIHFTILVLTYKALNCDAPAYISDLLESHTPSRSLRSSNQRLLLVPRTRFKTRGDRSFRAVAPRLWNALPPSLRCLDCIYSFKKQLKTHLFRLAFN
uniref:Reverse transcriptase domain-containing protein n=1 Tax=Oreochromis niloticus TaxID=8128 RepID=A0A669EIT0_ORENI